MPADQGEDGRPRELVGIGKVELQEGASLRAREERVSKRYDDEQRVVWAGASRLTSSPAPLSMTWTTRAPHGSSVGGCDMAAAAGGANIGLRSSAPPTRERAPRWGARLPSRLRPRTGVSVADVALPSGRSSAAPGRGSRPRCSRDGRATLRWPIARPIDQLFAAQRQTSAARSACAKSGPERALRCLEGRVSPGGTDWATVIARAPSAHHPGACFCHPPTHATT